MISIDVSFPTSPAGVPDERSEADYSVLDDIENALDHRFVPRLNLDTNEDGPAPDGNLYANTYVKLSQGVTAYYVVDPPQFLDNDSLSGHSSDDMDTPVILCMHGVTNTSYMYRDIAEQLAVNTSSQVIAFDFYGRGRSPWTGVKCSMETFVCQATELLDYLNIKTVSCLIGYDIGAAIAAGLVTKFHTTHPLRFSKLCLLSPVGLVDDAYCFKGRDTFKLPVMGELYMKLMGKTTFVANEVASTYFRREENQCHYRAICKANRMLEYQWDNTPGYRGALISTFRHFSLSSLSELYRSIGRQNHGRTSVCVIVGKRDALLPSLGEAENEIHEIFNCHDVTDSRFEAVDLNASGKRNSGNRVVCLENCGHHVVFEDFEEVVELLIQHIGHCAGNR